MNPDTKMALTVMTETGIDRLGGETTSTSPFVKLGMTFNELIVVVLGSVLEAAVCVVVPVEVSCVAVLVAIKLTPFNLTRNAAPVPDAAA
jgi:hypothetical protein